MAGVLPLKMLGVLAVVLLACDLNEGRIMSKCYLRNQLKAAQFQVLPDNMTVEDLIARLVCRANISGFNTHFVKFITKKHEDRNSSPTSFQTPPLVPTHGPSNDSPQNHHEGSSQGRPPTPSQRHPRSQPQGHPPSPLQNQTQVSSQARPPTPIQNQTQVSSQARPPTLIQNQTHASSEARPPTPIQNQTQASSQARPPFPIQNQTQASSQARPPTPIQNHTQDSSEARPPSPFQNQTQASSQIRPPPQVPRPVKSQAEFQAPTQDKPPAEPQNPSKGPNRKSRRSAPQEPKSPAVWHQYGVFQLNDKLACDSGVVPTLNVCQMNCSALIDDQILDDMICLKVLARTMFDSLLVKECQNVIASEYFAECEH